MLFARYHIQRPKHERMQTGYPASWSGLEGHFVTGPIGQIVNLPQPSGYLVKSVAGGWRVTSS
jgi:hypothetical protein